MKKIVFCLMILCLGIFQAKAIRICILKGRLCANVKVVVTDVTWKGSNLRTQGPPPKVDEKKLENLSGEIAVSSNKLLVDLGEEGQKLNSIAIKENSEPQFDAESKKWIVLLAGKYKVTNGKVYIDIRYLLKPSPTVPKA